MKWHKRTQRLQVDLTSYCNARCGACVRNVYGGETKPYLKLNHLDKTVWQRLAQQDTRGWLVQELTLNGNWGDCFMHPHIIPMLNDWSSHHPETALYAHTNGSMRDTEFWRELADTVLWFNNHLVLFALDGLADTHSTYRRGTDFNRIVENIGAFTDAGGHAGVVMTLFQHNEHQVEAVEQLAHSLGCDRFELRHSHAQEMYLHDADTIQASTSQQPRTTHWENNKPLNRQRDADRLFQLNDDLEHTPDTACPWYSVGNCQIDPWGNVWPCCHLSWSLYERAGDFDWQSEAKNLQENFNNLAHNTLTDILSHDWFNKRVHSAVRTAAWEPCRRICGVQK